MLLKHFSFKERPLSFLDLLGLALAMLLSFGVHLGHFLIPVELNMVVLLPEDFLGFV